jgi:ribosomal protein S18 acetylase RimI-like enzyme
MQQDGDTCLIRPLSPDDIEVVASLTAASWQFAYRGIIDDGYLDSLTGANWHDKLQARIKEPLRHALCMEKDGIVIGTSWFGLSTTEGYLEDGEITAFYLLPEYIGRGYGRPLMERTEQELAKLGYTNLVLDAFIGNDRAIRFYEHHGFVIVDSTATYEVGGRDYPFVIMRKALLS